MSLKIAVLPLVAAALALTAGCTAPGDAPATGGAASSTEALQQTKAGGLIDFNTGSIEFVWGNEDTRFYTAETLDGSGDICLLPLTTDGEDLGGACTDGETMVLGFDGQTYAFGADPRAEFDGTWEEVATNFWVS